MLASQIDRELSRETNEYEKPPILHQSNVYNPTNGNNGHLKKRIRSDSDLEVEVLRTYAINTSPLNQTSSGHSASYPNNLETYNSTNNFQMIGVSEDESKLRNGISRNDTLDFEDWGDLLFPDLLVNLYFYNETFITLKIKINAYNVMISDNLYIGRKTRFDERRSWREQNFLHFSHIRTTSEW
jgi:hypothetical protein